ncbi:MAG: DNA repair protein RadC [Symbiobacterium sp.]|uniref:RadC family protein n=1 Tax=Symbiobacterium sp. TaxID=1971213 RepID=UPI0034642A4A
MTASLKRLPEADRPRERLLRLGPEQLSDVELLAILLGTGSRGQSVIEVARDLLHHCEAKDPGGGLRALLHLRDVDKKELVKGLGPAKVCTILAGLHLGLRAAAAPIRQVELSNPRAVYEYLAPRLAHLTREEFHVILLTAKNHVIAVECVSEGTLTASLVHPREVFKAAIRRSAHAVILAHNHPSGDPTPSREDREITRRLVQAGRVIGIEVLDHVVVGKGRYISFRERGLLTG